MPRLMRRARPACGKLRCGDRDWCAGTSLALGEILPSIFGLSFTSTETSQRPVFMAFAECVARIYISS
ncbi:hypothetical protein GT037_008928 [Alternaria burnsii]|uniref:Uncharacterized protein n=1 Tax=Alternaria burnsii TaxID=1187904 RepID=A0A8H7B0C0_9PLEO|nr:uncharacterized protein GT037_008928 [Alternaria burnsii]KAF7672977.1 hypothetical protein GT037_008928 [Alternaria burnsii]